MEIQLGYKQCAQRLSVLVDYCDAMHGAGLTSASDLLQFARANYECCRNLCDAKTGQDRAETLERLRSVQRKMEAAESVVGQTPTDASHPSVRKLLSHFKELSCDIDRLLEMEVLLGRDMVEIQEKMGSATIFQEWLTTNCPFIKWDAATAIMQTALDSALAAKFDDDETV
jgi:hypothetical protein